jgi:hypothetical protein
MCCWHLLSSCPLEYHPLGWWSGRPTPAATRGGLADTQNSCILLCYSPTARLLHSSGTILPPLLPRPARRSSAHHSLPPRALYSAGCGQLVGMVQRCQAVRRDAARRIGKNSSQGSWHSQPWASFFMAGNRSWLLATCLMLMLASDAVVTVASSSSPPRIGCDGEPSVLAVGDTINDQIHALMLYNELMKHNRVHLRARVTVPLHCAATATAVAVLWLLVVVVLSPRAGTPINANFASLATTIRRMFGAVYCSQSHRSRRVGHALHKPPRPSLQLLPQTG